MWFELPWGHAASQAGSYSELPAFVSYSTEHDAGAFQYTVRGAGLALAKGRRTNGKHHPPVRVYRVQSVLPESTTPNPPTNLARDSTGRVHARLAAPPLFYSTVIYRSPAFMVLLYHRDMNLIPTPPAARGSSADLGP